MKTKIKAGLYQDETTAVYEIAENDEGWGWTAHRVREIVKRVDSAGANDFTIHRDTAGHQKVTIEFWHTLHPFEIGEMPDLKSFQRAISAARRAGA